MGSYGQNSSHSPTATASGQTIDSQTRFAEEAAKALMQPPGGSGHYRMANANALTHSNVHHTPQTPPPPHMPGSTAGGSGSSTPVVQMQSSIPGNVGMIAQHQHGRRNRRWYLGIQSKKDPAHVMTEVYKALMALDCQWLQLSSYRIKCRWRPNSSRRVSVPPGSASGMTKLMAGGDSPDGTWSRGRALELSHGMEMAIDGDENDDKANPVECKMEVISGSEGQFVSVPNLCTPDYCIKIVLTLYKVQQSIYLLDFQKMTGDAFSFMTLCANIITELKTLSAASKAAAAQQAQAVAAAQNQAAMQSHAQEKGK